MIAVEKQVPGDILFIPSCRPHQVFNTGNLKTQSYSISTPESIKKHFKNMTILESYELFQKEETKIGASLVYYYIYWHCSSLDNNRTSPYTLKTLH